MTLPADHHSEDDKTPDSSEASKALQTAGSSPVNPFLGSASDSVSAGPLPPRAFMSRILDYSAHAAIIVGLIGFAWTVSDHVVSRPVAKSDTPMPVAVAAVAPPPIDEMGQLKLANLKMHDEIKALKMAVETLKVTARRDTTPEQVRMLSAGLDSMKGSIGTTTAAIAQMNGKIDKLQPAKMQQLTERVGRLEHQALDSAATGSIPKPDVAKSADMSAPKPPVKPASLASAEDMPNGASDDGRPQVISGWVVRDVYQGVALVESKRGSMEVVPGVALPGAGVVKSIERHGSTWTVTTTKGQFASAATAPQREYRHNPYRGGYSPYRYGY